MSLSDDPLPALSSTDRFMVLQEFKPLLNQYLISIPAEGSTEPGQPLLVVKQKRLKIKEDIRFRRPDQGDESHEFAIQAKTVFEFRGRFDVLDAAGTKIGSIAKDFKKSLLRSHWIVRDAADEVVLEARESSIWVALIRRFAGALPYGDLLTWIPFNFTLFVGEPDNEAGTYQRVLGKFRDRYVVELGPALEGVDRRLVLAQAVALDALQDR
jgi:uncharacterized protein YxjI